MTDDNTPPTPPADRPLGFWLRAVDALLTQEIDAALAAAGADRRMWMTLNVLAGEVDAPGFRERLARKPKALRHLSDRGWVDRDGDDWRLTNEGRRMRDTLAEAVAAVRTRVAGAVSPEDFRTTMASLEAIARELGWNETDPRPWRGWSRHPRHRFGLRPFAPEGEEGFGGNPHHGFPGAGPRPDGIRPRPWPGHRGRPGDPRQHPASEI
jgi:hypothetical protein